ncbi:hypothetical protein [Magnetovirga frankeli]|uniref:hypothetical protein n=1 Tax=Magnetovirga frankeli TaxID=947516 RepID=UPI003D34E4AF
MNIRRAEPESSVAVFIHICCTFTSDLSVRLTWANFKTIRKYMQLEIGVIYFFRVPYLIASPAASILKST